VLKSKNRLYPEPPITVQFRKILALQLDKISEDDNLREANPPPGLMSSTTAAGSQMAGKTRVMAGEEAAL